MAHLAVARLVLFDESELERIVRPYGQARTEKFIVLRDLAHVRVAACDLQIAFFGPEDRVILTQPLQAIAHLRSPAARVVEIYIDVHRMSSSLIRTRTPGSVGLAACCGVLFPVGNQQFHGDSRYDLQIFIEKLVEEPIAGMVAEEGQAALGTSALEMR